MSDYYMPDELLTKILKYLPAKSLVRFTCVCKSWKSLITSSDFITTHLNQAKISNNTNNHLLLFRYCPNIPDNERISLHIDNDTFHLYDKLDFPFFEPYFRVLGSCNGLILLSNVAIARKITLSFWDNRTLMLWNPSIRKSLTLPPPQFMFPNPYQSFGFGFDSQTNDYKLVRLVSPKSKVELFKLSTMSWETITATFDPSYFFHYNQVGGAFINGAVHWTVSKKDSSLILSFNMSDEEFSEIMPPANLHAKFGLDIAVCGEWLSLFHIHDYKYCSVWAMKEYGVVESWTKLYTLDLKGELRKPLGFKKNGELILEKSNKELVSYDPENQNIKYLGNFYYCRELCSGVCEFSYYVEAYVESLELLGAANRLGSGPSKEANLKNKKRHFHES